MMNVSDISKWWVGSWMLTFVAWAVASEEASPSLRLSDQLENAIYLHEAEADLGKAEEAYRSILEEGALVDSVAAEASYRLALVYLDQGKRAMATKLLNELIKDYPEESLWVAEAEALLPRRFVPEITPWEDGERTHYEWVLPTGDVVGQSFSTIYSYEWEGRQLWRKESRFVLNGHRATAVEFDKETFNTVFGRMNLDAMGNCRAWYSDDGLEVTVEYSKSGESRQFNFGQRVYDNEQAVDLLRQLPIELGYQMSKKIFVSFSGMPLDINFEIKSIEEIDTVLGRIECYEVEIDMHVQKQSVVFTADERRVPVIFKVGGVEAHLTKLETIDFETERPYRNDEHGFSFSLPSSWSVIKDVNRSDESDQVLWLAEPMVRGIYRAASEYNSDWKREDSISIDGLREEITKNVVRQFEGVDPEPEVLSSFEVAGMPGKKYVHRAPDGLGLMGDVYLYIILGEDKHFVFQGVIPKADVENMLPTFDKIAMSLDANL